MPESLDKVQELSDCCLRDTRQRAGVRLIWALLQNVRTCVCNVKRKVQIEGLYEDESREVQDRGGVLRSSEEASVMEVERRGHTIRYGLMEQLGELG